MPVNVSIIVCTRNRARSLERTLAALAALCVPDDVVCELLVVDNGSTDDTSAVLSAVGATFENMRFQALSEPQKGKSRALNRALATARGDVLLFTDDDVIPPADWIDGMCAPILQSKADAVAGGLKLGLQVNALGLGAAQRSWLATTEYCQRAHDPPLIGANMAIARRVLDTVPWFDPEVGPGAIGHAEDTLFWLQVRAAGFRIVARYDVVAEHNPDPARTSRRALSQLAVKHGEFAAYVDYHWNGISRRHPYLALGRAAALLWHARLAHLPRWKTAQTLAGWEMELLEQYHFRRRLLVEQRRPANYAPCGLIKQRGVLPDTRAAFCFRETPITTPE